MSESASYTRAPQRLRARIVLFAVWATLSVGASPGAAQTAVAAPRAEVRDYYPLTLGHTWEMAVQQFDLDGTGRSRQSYTVTIIEQVVVGDGLDLYYWPGGNGFY